MEASLEREPSQLSEIPAPVSPNALLHIPNSPSSINGAQRSKKAEGTLTARFAEIDDLQEQLVKQANQAVERLGEQEGKERKQAGGGVAADFRRQRLQQVMALLERETALVDAVTERLGRLGVGL